MRAAIAFSLVLVLVAGGCGNGDSGENVIHGVWVTEFEGKYLTFNEDGSWAAQAVLDVEVFKDAGAFTFDGEVLMVRSDSRYACARWAEGSDEGSYAVDFTDADTIGLTVIGDSCTPRRRDFTSGAARYSP
jgi:hypothetical protein